MDILYVIGRGSKWENNELRYSLRSLDKNGINVGNIFIAGYCPRFIDQSKVTFVPVEDEKDCKHKNILNCIERVVEYFDIADDFLYSSDDHFYVRPTDFDNYPFYRKPVYLPDEYEEGKSYNNTLYSTRLLLEAAGLPAHNFAWHGNTHFNKTLFLEPQFASMRRMSYHLKSGIEPSILMLNYWLAKRPFEITDRQDNKFPTVFNPDELVKTIKTRECISCADCTPPQIKAFLCDTFPNKSRWEV